jgi:hypothetical protein
MFATIFKNSHQRHTAVKTRFIRPDVAAVDVNWEMTGQRMPREIRCHFVKVAELVRYSDGEAETAPTQATGLEIEITMGGFMKGTPIISTLAVFTVLTLANLKWAQSVTSFSSIGITATVGKTDEQTIRDLDAEWSRAAENKEAAEFTFSIPTPHRRCRSTRRSQPAEQKSRSYGHSSWPSQGSRCALRLCKSRSRNQETWPTTLEPSELKLNDAQGSPMTIPGKYVVIWKKQKGGDWKAEADIFNANK